jgi:hypothetical protein
MDGDCLAEDPNSVNNICPSVAHRLAVFQRTLPALRDPQRRNMERLQEWGMRHALLTAEEPQTRTTRFRPPAFAS